MIGTTIAQAIPIAISPILTRIYTPEDFGVFALYIAIASIVAVVSTLRYELAIMLPQEESDAANIVVLSILIAFGTSLLILALVFFFNTPITNLLGNPQISNWLYFIPLTVLLTGIYQSLNYWSNRKKHYVRLATSRVIQGSITATANLGMGLGGMRASGLVLGGVVGQSAAVVALARMILREDEAHFSKTSVLGCYALARKYSKFPRYSTWGALLDNASLQMPIFILSKFFQVDVVGFFGFTFKVLNLPMALIGGSISQVFFQKMSRAESSDVYAYVLEMLSRLALIILPFVLFFFFFGEIIFAFIFGENWRVAGTFAHILIFAVAIRFVVSPLSVIMLLDQHITTGTLWQTIYFITIVSTLLLASSLDIITFLKVFVIHELSLYLLYLYFILNSARKMRLCAA